MNSAILCGVRDMGADAAVAPEHDRYGAPVSTSYPSNGMQTCWFGNDGRFVTLQFLPTYGADGIMRYYTTLSFGL